MELGGNHDKAPARSALGQGAVQVVEVARDFATDRNDERERASGNDPDEQAVLDEVLTFFTADEFPH